MSDVPPPAGACVGRLVLVPNSLDLGAAEVALDAVLARGALCRAAALTHWVVENAKTARAFLKRVEAFFPLAAPLRALDIVELPRPRKGTAPVALPTPTVCRALLAPALAGADIGLLCEAGLPAVADPGAALVAAAHALGLIVEPLAGASSITLALAASGLNGQRFAFEGYLPQDAAARQQRIKALEQRSRAENQTQLAIETPYRNAAVLAALLQALNASTRLAVACGLTLPGGFCRTLTVAQWKALAESERTLPDRLPAVFMWLAV